MHKEIRLFLGLISGTVLMLINNELTYQTMAIILSPFSNNNIILWLKTVCSNLLIILSFLGTIITVTFCFLILFHALRNK